MIFWILKGNDMKHLTFLILCLASGCIHTIEIQHTKKWEGHYVDVESFKKATDDMQLDKDESVWVLSNKTLNRILKNTER